ncbi:hypothetical protein T484DRAFT_1903056 [Baffinella frigidus]|nr:hypothetical protein T484DRAFT_1903056 [Cryptophyta sp. CCMP2293]
MGSRRAGGARALLGALACLLATHAAAFLAPGPGRFALRRPATAAVSAVRARPAADVPRIWGGAQGTLVMSADEERKAKYAKVPRTLEMSADEERQAKYAKAMELAKRARAPQAPAAVPSPEPAAVLTSDGPASFLASDKPASVLAADKPASVSSEGPASGAADGPASDAVGTLPAGQTTSGIGGSWTPPEDVRSPKQRTPTP